MTKYTVENIKGFIVNKDGYTIYPSGDYTDIKEFGNKCIFGEDSIFGEWCGFGEHCSFGDHCNFGICCKFGERCGFGNYCNFGEQCRFLRSCSFRKGNIFGVQCSFREHCGLGKWCSFGEHCTFEEGCTCEDGKEFTQLYMIGDLDPKNITVQFWLLADKSIYVRQGYFSGTLNEFSNQVHETHEGTKYEKEYMAAIELAKIRFEL